MKRLPYFPQKNLYYCGPAVVQMILAFFNKKISQRQLATQAKTNPKTGTSRLELVRLLRRNGFRPTVHRTATIKTLRQASERGFVIVNYQDIVEEDHYAIVSRVTATHVILCDPWHGPRYRLAIPEFRKRWRNPSLRQKYTGWMVAMRET